MPPQQVTIEPAPMKGIKRTNAVVIREQGMGAPPRRDPYAIEIDRRRNCYACGGFEYMAHHCRNQGQRGRVTEGRRLDHRGGRIKGNFEHLNNLKGMENLESLD